MWRGEFKKGEVAMTPAADDGREDLDRRLAVALSKVLIADMRREPCGDGTLSKENEAFVVEKLAEALVADHLENPAEPRK